MLGIKEEKTSPLATSVTNRIKKLTYVGEDSWRRPVYIDENGKYWKDTDNRKDWLSNRNICSSVRNAFDGEPDCPISPYFTLEFIPERIVR